MSRRCKAGQRARVLSGSDKGTIVLVVRRYMGERINDAFWPEPLFPWVVTTLGAPLHWARIDGSTSGTASTVVRDDRDLEPLKDDDDGLSKATGLSEPRRPAERVPS
jgi:hypothetical protein